MNGIIRFSMKNTVAVLILVALLIATGTYSLLLMKTEKYPNIDIPYYYVNIPYPGASAKQAMSDIGKQLSASLNNIDGMENVYTYAYPNFIFFVTEFEMDKEMEEGKRQVQDAVSQFQMPDGAKNPTYREQTPDNPDLMTVAFNSEDPKELRRVVNELVSTNLRSVDGVEEVRVTGLPEQQIRVQLKMSKMKEKNVTFDYVRQILQSYDLQLPLGDVEWNGEKLPIRTSRALNSLEDVKNIEIPVPVPPQLAAQIAAQKMNPLAPAVELPKPVKLSELGEVTLENDPNAGLARLNGKPAVLLSLIPKAGEDQVQIVRDARASLEGLDIGKAVQYEIIRDDSKDIEQSVNNMLREVALGALMAVIVTLLFLRNIRATLIAILSIPLSMFASFIVLYQLGYTLNIVTLAGIAVAIGRVVDDSIVVIENIFRRVRAQKERNQALVEESTREVSLAITSSTITTVAVFIPLAFVPGLVGRFFVPLAWTIVVSLLFSLLVAVTVVPLLSKLTLLKIKPHEPRENLLQRSYKRLLQWCLKNRAVSLLISIAILAAVVGGLGPKLGFNFLPAEKIAEYTVDVKMPLGTALTKTDEVMHNVQDLVRKDSRVDSVITTVGAENGKVMFRLKDDTDQPKVFEEQMREQLTQIKDVKSISLSGKGGPGDNGLAIIVNGPDLATIEKAVDQMLEKLRTVSGLVDVRSTAEGEKPEISFIMDEEKLTEKALTPGMVALAVNRMVDGSVVSKIELNGENVDVRVSLAPSKTDPIQWLSSQPVTNLSGQNVKIGDIAKMKRVKSTLSVQEMNQKAFLQINATITDANTSQVNSDAQAALESLDLPNGITWSTLGAAKEMTEGFINMGVALGISILLIFLVMLISFGEAIMPVVILAAIPFSLIGAVLGLFIMDEPIGMPALIGLLMLNGIVVTNAIVLLERVRQNADKGMNKMDALIEAGGTRLRPILMTAIATIGALLPLAFSDDTGLISRSLAVVVIGGLTTSTLLTLVVVPILYSIFKPATRRRMEYSEMNQAAE